MPGGAATAIKAGRTADNVVDAVNAIDNVTDAVRAVDNSADEATDIVYRVIRPDEIPELGIFPKDPTNMRVGLHAHVANGSKLTTRFISATRSEQVAVEYALKTGNRIIEFDLNKVYGSIYDLSVESNRLKYLNHSLPRNFAKKSAEVVIEGHIPSNAIQRVISIR